MKEKIKYISIEKKLKKEIKYILIRKGLRRKIKKIGKIEKKKKRKGENKKW